MLLSTSSYPTAILRSHAIPVLRNITPVDGNPAWLVHFGMAVLYVHLVCCYGIVDHVILVLDQPAVMMLYYWLSYWMGMSRVASCQYAGSRCCGKEGNRDSIYW